MLANKQLEIMFSLQTGGYGEGIYNQMVIALYVKVRGKQWYIAFGLAYIAAYNVYVVNEHEKAVEKEHRVEHWAGLMEFFQALDQNLDRNGMELCAVTMYFLWQRSIFSPSIWRVFKSSLVKIMSTNLMRICGGFSFCLKLNYFWSLKLN